MSHWAATNKDDHERPLEDICQHVQSCHILQFDIRYVGYMQKKQGANICLEEVAICYMMPTWDEHRCSCFSCQMAAFRKLLMRWLVRCLRLQFVGLSDEQEWRICWSFANLLPSFFKENFRVVSKKSKFAGLERRCRTVLYLGDDGVTFTLSCN